MRVASAANMTKIPNIGITRPNGGQNTQPIDTTAQPKITAKMPTLLARNLFNLIFIRAELLNTTLLKHSPHPHRFSPVHC